MKNQKIQYGTAILAIKANIKNDAKDDLWIDYDDYGDWYESVHYNITQSMLQKWLREKKETWVYIIPCFECGDLLSYDVWINGNKTPIFKDTYEEALEAGLTEALKLIILC